MENKNSQLRHPTIQQFTTSSETSSTSKFATSPAVTRDCRPVRHVVELRSGVQKTATAVCLFVACVSLVPRNWRMTPTTAPGSGGGTTCHVEGFIMVSKPLVRGLLAGLGIVIAAVVIAYELSEFSDRRPGITSQQI